MRRTSGISLMLLIFLSLCLIIFSLLSVSGAVADQTLSRQAADRTTEYYAAVTSANELLSRIDGCLAAYLRETADGAAPATQENADAYLHLCSRIGDDILEATWEDGRITFSVDVSEDQILRAELEVSWPVTDETALYQIRTWKVVNTAEWTADNSMNLFRLGDSDSG